MKKAKIEKRWVAICKHDHSADPSFVYVGTYEEVLDKAGKFFKGYDLQFDLNDPRVFWDDENYVDVVKDKKDRVIYVSHADGDGPNIFITQESK